MNRRQFLTGATAIAAVPAMATEKKTAVTAVGPEPGEIRLTFLGTSHGSVTSQRMCSCTLVQYRGRNYVVDAADGSSARIMRVGVNIPDVHAVFITHPHDDHFGGLPMLIKQHSFQNWCYHRDVKAITPLEVLLPDADLEETMRLYHSRPNVGTLKDYQHLKTYKPGVIYRDDFITVTAYGNDHMGRRADGSQIAHSLLMEFSNGRRVYFSGDLSEKFDLPLDPFKDGGKVDLLVCEHVHYPDELAVKRLKGLPVAKICFQHYWDSWETPGWQERFAAFASQLTMPAERVTDYDVRNV